MAKKTGFDFKKIKKANYNPRTMGARNKAALKSSIRHFDDISGIVINTRTGNVLAGNHRWEQLCDIHGEKNIGFENLRGEFNLILSKGDPTNFIARLVDWDVEKEKAANVAANSPLLAGEFTSGLQDVLAEIQDYIEVDFEALRFDEISIDFGDLSAMGEGGINDPGAVSDKIRENAEEDNIMLDTEGGKAGDVKIVKTSIKILVPGDKADMIREDLIEFLSERPYYDELEIH